MFGWLKSRRTDAQDRAGNATGLLEQGHAALQAGNPGEAKSALTQALGFDPGQGEAHYLLAGMAFAQGEAAAAHTHYRRAIECLPALEPAYLDYCRLLAGEGQLEQAAQLMESGLEQLPESVNLRLYLGNLRHEQQRHAEAASHFEQALALQPDNPALLANLGLTLLKADRLDEAETALRRALQRNPDSLDAGLTLGNVLLDLGRFEEAVQLFEQTRQHHGEHPVLLSNLGLALLMAWRPAPAAQVLQQALALAPDLVDAHLSLGRAQVELGRMEDAQASFRRVLDLDAAHAAAHYNLGYVAMLQGKLEQGWPGFDYRDRQQGMPRNPEFPQPKFSLAADVAGKTVLLFSEQGFGDTLQFIRYATLVAQRGARVLVLVPRPLQSLAGSCPGVAAVIDASNLPAFDFYSPLMSLPGIFGTGLASIPAHVPYLGAAPERLAHWQAKLGAPVLPRVGLVWSGDPRKTKVLANQTDAMRSMHFDRMRPLTTLSGIEFHSLQLGADARAQMRGSGLIDHADQLFDFQETAALIEQLDLVISVDTSVVHLAGALGKPVWMLNRYNTCWRWMLERDDSPWYPGMRIFRQPALGDWDSVIVAVQAALRERYGLH